MPIRRVFISLVAWSVLVSAAIPALAQPAAAPPSRAWTIDVHGGVINGAGALSGQGQLPPPGEPYSVAVMFQSRKVPTWFFGDGPLLFNQFRAASPPQQVAIPGIVPLDDTLQRGIVRHGGGGVFGARVSRAVGGRFGLEFTVDRHGTARRFTDDVGSAIETTRRTYAEAMAGFWARQSPATTELTITDDFGSELVIAGAVNVTLTRSARLESYVTIGAGAAQALGDAPAFTIIGHNRPLQGDVVALDETDRFTVTTEARPGAVFLAGGGVMRSIGSRGGIRLDARMQMTQDRMATRVSATPSVAADIQIVVVRAVTPTIVFSAFPPIPNSLSATLTDFESFAGSGTRTQVSLTAGYFFRF
jgi:hypothetical protein